MNFEVSTNGVMPENMVTLKHSGLTKADEGKPVKIVANNTAALAVDGDLIFGVIQKVEATVVTVLVTGVITLPYTGTTPTVNSSKLVANATNGVKVDGTNGLSYKVLAVDTTNTKVNFILG
jgi:hypothetical protein